MPEEPLQIINDTDPEFYNFLENTREMALAKGCIPLKYKFLIAMALDASKGATNGVTALAMQAMHEGATKEDVMEAIKITQYICGVGSVYTAANALKDVL